MTEQLNYSTCAVGKNHFFNSAAEPNATAPPPSHGWASQFLYDGLGRGMLPDPGGEFDDYDAWFAAQTGGQDPLATGGSELDWNSWQGAAYEYAEALHPTAWVGARARAFLANASARPGQPFFLKVSFHRPHSPYDPPQRLLDSVRAEDLPPVVVGGNWGDEIFAGPSAECGPDHVDAWCGRMPEPNFTLARRAYRANIRFVDEQVGLILADLGGLGLANSTWVLFTSDHGDGQGDHNLWRKCYPYELSAHVPGIISWPAGVAAALPRGSATPLLAELRDIFPTVLDIAGRRDLARALNGSSWACLVTDDPSGASCGSGAAAPGAPGPFAWRDRLDLEHSLIYNASIYWNAVISGALKYIFWAPTAREQLFDLASDAGELNDLALDPTRAADLARMRAMLLQQWRDEGRPEGTWYSASGELLTRSDGQTYSPNYPAPPAPPRPTPPACNASSPWFGPTVGGYYKGDNLAQFSALTLDEARARCCAAAACAGLDFAADEPGNPASKGSGFLKVDAGNGWTDSAQYVGLYKPGMVPGH